MDREYISLESQEKIKSQIDEMIKPFKNIFRREELGLSDLIKKRKWSTFFKQLSLDPNQVNSPNRKESILHEVCRYRPPLKVLRKLIAMYPALVDAINFQGRLPLHIATENGASFDVILCLCRCNPTTAGLQDLLGKTPLHLLFEESSSRYEENTFDDIVFGAYVNNEILRIVEILVLSSPETVNLEDITGMSALEYALIVDGDRDVVCELQRASVKEWRRRNTQGEKNTNIVNNMEKQSQERIVSLCKDLDNMKCIVPLCPKGTIEGQFTAPKRSPERRSLSAASA